MSFPDFFALNDQPVKIVKKPDGSGMRVLALDMSTGEWVSGMEQFDRYLKRDGELEILNADEFKARVSETRQRLGIPEFE